MPAARLRRLRGPLRQACRTGALALLRAALLLSAHHARRALLHPSERRRDTERSGRAFHPAPHHRGGLTGMREPKAIRTIGVIGGGSAGYLAALTLRARLPDTEI